MVLVPTSFCTRLACTGHAHVAAETIIIKMTALLIVVAAGKLWVIDGPAECIDADHFRGSRLMVPIAVATALAPEMVVGTRIHTQGDFTGASGAATSK